MTKFIKKKIILTSLLVFFFSVCSTRVDAAMTTFKGSAGYSYAYVCKLRQKTTESSVKVQVKWTDSDTDCKMWFKCVDSSDTTKGKSLLTGTSSSVKYLNDSTTTKGKKYRLMTSREHLFNPSNYVEGTWEP